MTLNILQRTTFGFRQKVIYEDGTETNENAIKQHKTVYADGMQHPVEAFISRESEHVEAESASTGSHATYAIRIHLS